MGTTFQGFDKCMKMMRSHDPQTQESGFHWLAPHANEYISELIEEFEGEDDLGLQCWLIELIGAAKSPNAFSFLSTQLRSNNWQIRQWAISGLKELDTKEARTLLWKAQSFEMETAEDTERLRSQLESQNIFGLDGDSIE
ncbi:hypothetical protein CA11_00820 [Gimesia maris]|jgi:hypothetical protein|uniref:HEAT repeat domain-containing protein n=1 Tax=Gimesia maris TaxID=122 RepID=UPI0011884C41|nr:HEAT repeat domain-containing protein [Gimesia maris]QDU12305.1 hypothetical protein CA11_00820 [Gimesia maris]|tara:strand:+ start:3581 stop:4000 length:420 start_codon:yes stop_codon:yes gene_type:complete